MKTITVAHISDLHLPFEPALSPRQRLSKRQLSAWSWRRRRAVHRGDILDRLTADLRALQPDHFVVTGDLVNFSLPGEFAAAAKWLHELAPADRVSVVPGNHDALVHLDAGEGVGRWAPWTRAGHGWPFIHHRGCVAFIGLDSARPTAPLLARGTLGAQQLARLEEALVQERRAGRIRVVLLHHPVADGAVGWRKALSDRRQFRAVLRRAGAELVLHGHARSPRLDAIAPPESVRGMIPCMCVASSTAAPNARDEAARWHRLTFREGPGGPQAEVTVRRWSEPDHTFVEAGRYELCLPS